MDRKNHPAYFFTQDETDRLSGALKSWEEKTDSVLKIFLEWQCPLTDPLSRAIKLFHHLGLDQTLNKKTILFYITTKQRAFAAVADQGATEIIPNHFWTELRISTEQHFRNGEFAKGMLAAIEAAGRRLAEGFPLKTQ